MADIVLIDDTTLIDDPRKDEVAVADHDPDIVNASIVVVVSCVGC